MSDPTSKNSNRDASAAHACVSLSALGAVTLANLAESANWTNSNAAVAIDSKPWACLVSATESISATESVVSPGRPEPASEAINDSATARPTESQEQDRLAQADNARKEQEAAAELVEKERTENERAEKERAAADLAEKERAEAARAEAERAEAERAEAERAEAERAEAERAEKERIEIDRAQKEAAQKEAAQIEAAEKQRAEKALIDKERAEKELADKQRVEKEHEESERAKVQRAETERAQKESTENARIEKERAEKAHAEQAIAQQQLADKERLLSEQSAKDREAENRGEQVRAAETDRSQALPTRSYVQAKSDNASRSSVATATPVPNRMRVPNNTTAAVAASATRNVSDAYLHQLEQLVLQLNLELALPGGSENADCYEQQVQALTQRLINLSLENLELRRQLAGEYRA